MKRLSRSFFNRSALEVAPDLLGRLLIGPDGVTAARIVETEAYMQDDPAFHAWGIVDPPTGLVKPSGRGYALFAPPGMSYVYLCYGVHWLLNVVTEPEGRAGCVLIRAAEPVAGRERMYARRSSARSDRDLCSGPGKLTQAFGVNGEHHQIDLCSAGNANTMHFADDGSRSAEEPAVSSRIGITRAIDRPWRFFYASSPHVSPGVPSDVAAERRRIRRNSGQSKYSG